MKLEAIEKIICSSLCADVRIVSQGDDLLYVSTPFSFSDGDAYSVYLQPLQAGGFRITDLGGTLMHLSYDNDVSKLREGTRGKVLRQILAETDLEEDDGEFYLDTPADQLGANIFRFGQAVTRIHDLTFLNKVRAESTFFDDLRERIYSIVDKDAVHEGYLVPGLPNSANYPVDFFIEGHGKPLYLFGVPSRDKAMLTTIVLQHLNAAKLDFRSMVVFKDYADLPRKDFSRLMNAANDMVSSLDADEALERKLKQA